MNLFLFSHIVVHPGPIRDSTVDKKILNIQPTTYCQSQSSQPLDQIINEINMDPDGDYESRHSIRSIGNILPKDAKLEGDDEEMGLKEGNIDSSSLTPPGSDLECLPSAPPLELSLHSPPEDDGPTSAKKEVGEGSNSIPDSVALPIGLDDADLALPVASVVPIITDATGTKFAPPPILPTEPPSRAPNTTHPDSFDGPCESQPAAETDDGVLQQIGRAHV